MMFGFVFWSRCVKWDCPSCTGNVETVVVYNSDTNANGFVGYDHDINTIIVAFSGTNPVSITNWIDDLDFFKINFSGYGTSVVNCTGCEVHEGFYKTYMSVADEVRAGVNGYLAQYPTATIAVTGHSLGASLALHAALDLAIDKLPVKSLYNFGQPRTGEINFSQYATSMLQDKIFRITHHKDPVPHVPLEEMGFHHEPTEVFYNWLNNEYTVCDSSGEDPNCANQYYVDLNVPDHLLYLKFDFLTNIIKCEL
jgi:predicted lipase